MFTREIVLFLKPLLQHSRQYLQIICFAIIERIYCNSRVNDDNERIVYFFGGWMFFCRDSNGLNRVEGLNKGKTIDWVLTRDIWNIRNFKSSGKNRSTNFDVIKIMEEWINNSKYNNMWNSGGGIFNKCGTNSWRATILTKIKRQNLLKCFAKL